MPVNILSIFSIARTALSTNQQVLGVTAHNISNVNTAGYTRQTAVLAETTPQNSLEDAVGTGVRVELIRRSVDNLLEGRLNLSHSTLGRLDVYAKGLSLLEGVFSDAQDRGLGVALNEFFNAAQDVATNPNDTTARTVLISKGSALAGLFNQAHRDLTNQRLGIDRQVQQSISEANNLIVKIADLNAKISGLEGTGEQEANDLRDERQRALNDLSKLLDVAYLEDATGMVNVYMGKGLPLVAGTASKQLVGVANGGNNGLLDVRYDPRDGTAPFAINSVLAQGKLKGLLDLRDTQITGVLSSLNTLASAIVTQVNTVHAAGYGLDQVTGRNFFSATVGSEAQTIATAISNPQHVAASSTLDGVPGNNQNALALVALQSAAVASLGNVTMGEYYTRLAASVGDTSRAAEVDLLSQEAIHEQLEQRRGEVSGVSLDEEMTDLIKFQRAYEASARLITVTDELLQTLLELAR
jgi:flagellar hook-associated protein 1 FlgK